MSSPSADPKAASQDLTVPPKPTVRQPSRLAFVAAAGLVALLFLLSGLFLPARKQRDKAALPPAPTLTDPQRNIDELLSAAARDRRVREQRVREELAARAALDDQFAGIPYLQEPGGPGPSEKDSRPASSYPAFDAPVSRPEPERTRATSAEDRLREALDSPILASSSAPARLSRGAARGSDPGFPEMPPVELLTQLLSGAPQPTSPPPPVAPSLPPQPAAVQLQALPRPMSPFTLLAGTVIPATLTSLVNSDLPGTATAIVSHDVYDSLSGRYLLIPRGSKLFGSYDANVGYGQDRILLSWSRLTLPDGTRFDLQAMPSADASGAAGLADKVDRHLGRLYGSALLLSLVSAGAQLSQPDSYNGALDRSASAGEVAAGALGQRLADVSSSLIERELRVKPTLTLRPGQSLNVVLTTDIVVPQ